MNKRVAGVVGIILTMTLFLSVFLSGAAMAAGELNGWVKENGKMRYYENGVMYRNRGLTKDGYSDGWADTYYFDDDGYMVTGFYRTMGGDGYYLSYFGPDGRRWQTDGWQKLDDGYWYYIENGFVNAPATNGVRGDENIATYYIDKALYGFDVNGHMITGWFQAHRAVQEYKPELGGYMLVYENGRPKMADEWLYFGSNGKAVTGWVQRNGKWCYCYEGLAQAGDVYEIDGKKYCFDDQGLMQANYWLQHETTSGGTAWFYFGSDGAMVKNGWKKISGKYYYFDDESMKTGWLKDNGQYYYLKPSSGAMATGFTSINNKYYYFSKTNGSLQVGFVKDGGKYYYFSKKNGTLQVGWVYDYGNYYFDPATGALKTGWLKYNGKYYYLSPSTGNPVTGTQKIDGKTYKFNSAGVCVG